ncbi:hypothetical protein AAKU55_005191 [Oxalobacteraceae bacterium GrIS 1.11]
MRKGWGQTLRIGVSSHAVCLLRSSRWRAPVLLAEHAVASGAAASGEVFGAIGVALEQVLAGQEHVGWPVSFVLDDELVRLWQVTPPQGASRLADIEAAAAMRFQSLYGGAAGDWNMVGSLDTRAAFFAAIPRALQAQLERAASVHGLRIVAIVPHFVQAWNRWQGGLKPGAWFGLLHEQLLTLGALENGRLRAVRTLPVPHGAEHYWLSQMLTREALLLNLSPPTLLQLCGQGPLSWNQPNPGQIACAPLDLTQGAAGLSPAATLARSGSGA